MRYIISLLTFALTLSVHMTAHACNCAKGDNIKDYVDRTDVIFLGRAEVSHFGRVRMRNLGGRVVEVGRTQITPLEVITSFKGVNDFEMVNGVKYIEVMSGRNEASCGYNFEFDQTYLVRASTNKDGELMTGFCTMTAIPDEDLKTYFKTGENKVYHHNYRVKIAPE